MIIWDALSDECKIALCNYQFEHHGTNLFWVNLKQPATMDTIPENDNLDKFMARAPESQKVN